MDAEQRAKELLSDELGCDAAYFGTEVPLDSALRAITRALTQAQPGWRVVPVEPTPLKHAYKPHEDYPWFCDVCGYPEHEKLKHTTAAPAPQQGEEDHLEAAAQAIHGTAREEGRVNDWAWCDLSERYKDEFRSMARAALAAAGRGCADVV